MSNLFHSATRAGRVIRPLLGTSSLSVILVLWLGFVLSAEAQRTTGRTGTRSTTRGTTGGGRSFGGGTTGSRSYYPSGMVGEAMVSSDPETRRLIVITDEETGEFISQVITNLDRPKPQVLIKVVFLEVTYRNALDIGFEGGFSHNVDGARGAGATAFGLSGLSSIATNLSLNALGIPTTSFASPGAGVYQVIGQDFQATLRAIAQAGKTEVLSRPSILTRNNQQATISLGQEVPLVTNTRFDTLGNQINTVTYQNVGIILRVTPFITESDMVEMIVAPETSGLADPSQWVPISADVSAPVINSRMADTVVVVPNGQTAVIGGLMQDNRLKSESKVPLLGDIPILGNLFKRRAKDDAKTELVIFLTPYIVREPAQLASMTQDERANTRLAPKAFTEEELNRYLDQLPNRELSPQESGADKKRSSRKR